MNTQTQTAADAYIENHFAAYELLDEIGAMVTDMPCPDPDRDLGGFMPSWGDVADLEAVLANLRRARDLMAQLA